VEKMGFWQEKIHQISILFLPNGRNGLLKPVVATSGKKPEVIASRSLLYDNLQGVGIQAEDIVLSHIERAMDKYFYQFNLTGLNAIL